VTGKCPLTRECAGDGVLPAGEDEEKGVSLCVDLATRGVCERLPQEPLVVREYRAVVFAEALQQASRPFDVREEKGDCACREVWHGASAR
jgi:hypothetical protein